MYFLICMWTLNLTLNTNTQRHFAVVAGKQNKKSCGFFSWWVMFPDIMGASYFAFSQQRKFKTTQPGVSSRTLSRSQTVASAAQLRKQLAETFAFHILLPTPWAKDDAEQQACRYHLKKQRGGGAITPSWPSSVTLLIGQSAMLAGFLKSNSEKED